MTPKEYEDIRSSFVLAMEHEDIDPDTITKVVDVVDDYVDNHEERFTSEEVTR